MERLLNKAVSVVGSAASSPRGGGVNPFTAAALHLGRPRLFGGSAAAAAPLVGAGRFLGGICPYTSPAAQGF